MSIRYSLPLLLVLFLGTCVSAQLENPNGKITFSGRVIDAGSEQPIEFATVRIAQRGNETAQAGTTTDETGRFSVDADLSDVFAEISFIGYETVRIDSIAVRSGRADLGTIVLGSQSQQLAEVTVRAEKSQTEFKLDKRVFNVGKDLSSTGASALEVLNNVPSVNVTIEGQVQLRGSGGVQILINGKPSVIASEQGSLLGTITADMIESIEVITNPSAKYDAEGTSGIINVVLKKEERKGLNGALSVNAGVPDNYSVGLSLNRRSEKFNLFSQLGVGYREMPNDEETINLDKSSGITLFGNGREFRNERYYNLVLGSDYHIDERNVLTLSGNLAYEIEDQPSSYDYRQTDAAGSTLARWRRDEATEATNPKYQFELQYKRDFKDHKDHNLIISAVGSLFSKDQASEFRDISVEGLDRSGRQQTRTNFGQTDNTFKIDYTKPISDKVSIEAGAQYVTNDVNNDFSVSNFVNGEFVVDPALTNVFNWKQQVAAAYGTWAYEPGAWGVKVGLRVENTDLTTLLESTNESNDRSFANLFPSGHASYKISDAVSLQGGYSRRIFRPRLWDLNPFFNPRNAFSVRTGNPNLQPEFTDSYELTSIFILGEASVNAGVYHRYTTDVVERITTFANNVALTQPVNVGTNRSTGLEVNAKVTPASFLTLTGDLNYNFFTRDGALEGVVFDFSASQYSGKITGKFDLPKDIDFEVTTQYLSAFQTVQGSEADQLFVDAGLRKRLFKGRGALSFSVRDLFASRIQISELEGPTFSQYRQSFRGRFLTMGFSYGFGKGETMEYLGQQRRY